MCYCWSPDQQFFETLMSPDPFGDQMELQDNLSDRRKGSEGFRDTPYQQGYDRD